MRYVSGKTGRVFVLRVDHGEDILESIRSLCEREGVKAAFFSFFGAARDGKFVVGPKTGDIPPVPVFSSLSRPSEFVGTGSVAEKDGEISVHLHAAFGSPDGVAVGCLREEGKAHVVTECVIFEVVGIEMKREFDEATGLHLLSPGEGSEGGES